jgi:hypothetical protein
MDCDVASLLAMTESGCSRCKVQDDSDDEVGLQMGKKHDFDFDGDFDSDKER